MRTLNPACQSSSQIGSHCQFMASAHCRVSFHGPSGTREGGSAFVAELTKSTISSTWGTRHAPMSWARSPTDPGMPFWSSCRRWPKERPRNDSIRSLTLLAAHGSALESHRLLVLLAELSFGEALQGRRQLVAARSEGRGTLRYHHHIVPLATRLRVGLHVTEFPLEHDQLVVGSNLGHRVRRVGVDIPMHSFAVVQQVLRGGSVTHATRARAQAADLSLCGGGGLARWEFRLHMGDLMLSSKLYAPRTHEVQVNWSSDYVWEAGLGGGIGQPCGRAQ